MQFWFFQTSVTTTHFLVAKAGTHHCTDDLLSLAVAGASIDFFVCFHKRVYSTIESKMMLTRSVLGRHERRSLVCRAIRAKSTQVDKSSDGPIAADGRHEVWREGIYDHDNEPK
jgi:hypothetical protein